MALRYLTPCLAILTLLAACGGAEREGGPPFPGAEAPIPAVEVVQAQFGALPLEKRLSGTVRADNQVVIYPEIAASVLQVTAKDGDYVQQGQPLVYLRDTQFREQLQQAQASLEISQAEARRTEAVLRELKTRLARTKELAAKQYQSQQELEAIQAQVDGAEATYQQALSRISQAEATVVEQQDALRQTIIRAPISGYIGQRNAEIGMQVDSGTQLFIIGNLSVLQVEVAINDELIGQIKEGQTAIITAGGLGGRALRAEVSRISPFLTPGSFSAEAEIDVPNPDGLLRPGMFVTVDVQYGETQQATLVPMSALYEDPQTGTLGIYVASSLGTEMPVELPETYNEDDPPPLIEPTPMSFKEVQVLARGQGVAGVQGIQPGDWVVTIGQNLLSENQQTNAPQARVRLIPWQRIAALQRLQDEDLLRAFMEKQQQVAQEKIRAARSSEPAPEKESPPVSASF